MIRNIIFDWSGTLVDDLPAVLRATNHCFTSAGKPELSLDQFRAEFCLPFQPFYDRHLPGVPMTQLEKWFHERFREVQDLVEPLPHAREFLVFCRERGVRTFLLSTVHPDHWETQAARSDFGQFIERPYTGVWDKRQVIQQLIAENGLDPQATVFIGDMAHDIETAKHGGIHSVAVLTGYNKLPQLRAAAPDLIVEHLGELRTLMTRHAMRLTPDPKHQTPDPTPISTVGGLILDADDRVLMIRTHKWSHLWGIPGGKIKWGERSEDALRRELKEETNLDLTDIRFVLVQDCIHSKEFYRDAHFLLLNYTCRAAGSAPPVTLNDEAEEFRWVELAEALTMELNQPTRILLEDVVGSRRGEEAESYANQSAS
jgi:phosphoglycolate phosphatase-like HAD superfamily hydrolase/ADP-ribose pyrophosphatase YjhB (NUDIX family)